MPIVTEQFALYHCPRTGGTWVRAVLDELEIPYEIVGNQHDTPEECPIEGKVTATIVREHFEWLASWTSLVATNPKWAWPVPSWLLGAKSPHDAASVFERYMAGVDFVLLLSGIREDLQGLLGRVGIDRTVPDIPPVNVRNY